jgi:hypothetical protein
MTKYLLFTALGMFLMYIILKILASKTTATKSETALAGIRVFKTQEFSNLLKTNEAKELLKTSEVRDFVKTLSNDVITSMSRSLVNYQPKV